MRNGIRRLAFAVLLVLASTLVSFCVAAQEVPKQLQAPPGERLLLQVHAKGDQVYTCKSDAAQFSWTLKAPDAQLFDKDGKSFGKHFAGPSWEANDGSRVVGKAVANAPSPDADSIPWLLVNVVAHEGSGVLSSVTILRAERRRHPDATPGTLDRKSALRIPPTTSSTHRNSFPLAFGRVISMAVGRNEKGESVLWLARPCKARYVKSRIIVRKVFAGKVPSQKGSSQKEEATTAPESRSLP
jgi:hypothetical protein